MANHKTGRAGARALPRRPKDEAEGQRAKQKAKDARRSRFKDKPGMPWRGAWRSAGSVFFGVHIRLNTVYSSVLKLPATPFRHENTDFSPRCSRPLFDGGHGRSRARLGRPKGPPSAPRSVGRHLPTRAGGHARDGGVSSKRPFHPPGVSPPGRRAPARALRAHAAGRP